MSTTRTDIANVRGQLFTAVDNRAGATISSLQHTYDTAVSEWASAYNALVALARRASPVPTAQELQDAKDLLTAKELARLDALDALTLAQRASSGFDGALTGAGSQYTTTVSGYTTP